MVIPIGNRCLGEFTRPIWYIVFVGVICATTSIGAQSVSLSADSETVEEHDRSTVTITATIDETQTSDLDVPLLTSGTALLGADFDLASLTIESGQTSGTAEFVPIRDWDEEGDETAEISVDTDSNSELTQDGDAVSITIEDSYEEGEGEREPVSGSDLFPYVETSASQTQVEVSVTVLNLGSEASDSSNLVIRLFDQSNLVSGGEVLRVDSALPSIAIFPSNYVYNWEIDLIELDADTTFVGIVNVVTEEDSNELNDGNNVGVFGFAIDALNEPIVTCEEPSRIPRPGLTDPLFHHQWHLENTGQTSLSNTAGTVGADMRMSETMASGLGGENIVVAIIDEGLEVCHPDLVGNVDIAGSVNFIADPSSDSYWYGASDNDPFNPDTTGDHGTIIAGAVAAIADNGLGGRGVAPLSVLRGFNFIQAQTGGNLITSFGGGVADQNTIDVVNMSFGSVLRSEYSSSTYDLYGWFTRWVRAGKGSLFVKASGNSFGACGALSHDIHREIGCNSLIADYTNNLPFVLVVGGFNAQDQRSSYSSVGSNLWISAPAGEYGTSSAALISADQFGLDRGYGVLAGAREPLTRDANANPNGDYTGLLNGTSAATAVMSGAVAVVLGVEPELTFRDVKHIFASTARIMDPDSNRVRVAVGQVPFVLQYGWVTNAAGYNYHNWFGFGGVDVDAAVAMAEDYEPDSLGIFAVSGWTGDTPDTSGPGGEVAGIEIPDGSGAGLVESLEVSLPLSYQYCGEGTTERHCIDEGELAAVTDPDDPDAPATEVAVHIEGVQLRFVGRHPRMSDLSIQLTSPSGTTSIVNPVFNNAYSRAIDDTDEFHFLSNAFYGEKPEGTWEIKIVDALAEESGELISWHLKFFVGQHPQDVESEQEN